MHVCGFVVADFAYLYACLLSIKLGVELLGHKIFLHSALVDTVKQFSKVVVLIYTPPTMYKYCLPFPF